MTTLLPRVSLSNKHQTPSLLPCRHYYASLLYIYNNPTSTSFKQIASARSPGLKHTEENTTPEYKLLLCCTFTRGWCEDDMATGAADGFFRYVHDGCLSGGEVGFDRRPYHRNCRCALHNSKENCSHTMSRYKNVSYPIKRCWSEGNLALMVANSSSSSSNSPPSSLQAGRSATTPHQRRSSHDLDVEDHVYSFKV